MPPDDAALLAGLRDSQPMEAVCRAAGVSPAEFETARDAWLARHAALGDRTLAGPVHGTVEILRDRAGVPHIYAASTTDLYFGLGFAMAQDRLWQMDRLRRRALGRQAEILGPAYAAADAAHLTVGLDEICPREAAAIDPATRVVVEAMVAGINRFIEKAGEDLPVEFRLLDYRPGPFSPRCVVAIARGFWWSLNGRIDRLSAAECARFFPAALRAHYLTPEASGNVILPGPGGNPTAPWACGTDDATGSNNWALAGSRTGTGQPIVCGDPHQPFWVPSSWYEFGLHGPEDDAAGCGHPGLPGLWWGSNGTAAWALTNNMGSTRDLYREEIDPADPGRYRDGDSWRRFETREVGIPVRGEPTRGLTIQSTVRGPVVNALVPALDQAGDPPLSLRWVGMEHLDDLRALIGLSRARTFHQFRDTLRDWSVPIFNWVFADRSGTIGYQMAGRLPVRGRIVPGYRDAGNPADRWAGYIPFEDMPNRTDPARGYLASANQRPVPADDPRPIYGAYSQGHRGVRMDQAFTTGMLGLKANIRFQNDVKSTRATRLAPHILRHLAGRADPDLAPLVAALSGWDGSYTLESTAPVVFETFMFFWQRAVAAEYLPERLLDLTMQQTGLGAALLEQDDLICFPAGTAATARVIARQAVSALRARLGDDPASWQWGRVHTAHWRHPAGTPALAGALDIGPASVDGGSHTVRNTGGELPPHAASSGAEYRLVVDLSAPDCFLAVQNIGNSGVPGSPHYRDQFEPWIRGEYHVVQLKRDALEVESTTRITPA
jgi:penicillin amidase